VLSNAPTTSKNPAVKVRSSALHCVCYSAGFDTLLLWSKVGGLGTEVRHWGSGAKPSKRSGDKVVSKFIFLKAEAF